MRRTVRTAAGLGAAALLAVVAGCANPADVASAPSTAASAATAASGQGAASAGSGVAIAPAPATTPAPALPPSSAPATTGACLDHVSVLYPGSDNPLRRTCVRVGGTVTITLTATGGYRWMAPTSSQPAVAAVGDVHTDPNGTLHATVTARTPGTATLSAADSFTPDPHGPPSRLWTLILDVR